MTTRHQRPKDGSDEGMGSGAVIRPTVDGYGDEFVLPFDEVRITNLGENRIEIAFYSEDKVQRWWKLPMERLAVSDFFRISGIHGWPLVIQGPAQGPDGRSKC